ncbi:AT-rich interactive domain-containing protein 4b-like [Plakobranchus ocellatus]|uniref:AT-rich interactive domain-containing protein 4b-like n=1 Tax=Plakobranchus ocellatus TaxID=259542 RepID=A0AAV4BE00_9GAST|nr:AT-rich interactive domain-containing protein 4b-like [Plakobranchus ocellatus]
MAQQGYGPPSLPVGTEVSAKYRGAFCEATVKSVVRLVKCKVVMKDCQSSVFVTDDEIKGVIKLAALVEVKHPDTGQPVEATINKLIDHSTYTVVFDDGDERTLRRSQLCLKGDKHFIESETLDNLPLSHPEHFGTPVLQNKKVRRRNGEESEEDEDDEEVEEDSEGETPRRATYRGRHQELVGKLMLVDIPHRKGSVMPALVVLPDANSLNEVKGRDQILLRSFKDSKFIIVNRKELKEFSRSAAIKNEDKTMRIAFEKALLYFDTKELPVGWNKSEMLGSDIEDDEDDNGEDEYASEDEPFEEKDRFVAQLYKFMDDRGTPINKGPCIGNKDLNLYKLFKIVQHLGGYNKVTKEMKWPVVYSKMGLPSLHLNPAHQIKTAYKKYLDAYETFFRKLGSTMGTLSRPGRARQNSGRNILSFRARERSPRSPKPPEKNKDDVTENLNTKAAAASSSVEKIDDPLDSSSVTSTEDGDVVTRRTPRREARTSAVREESKERKEDNLAKSKKDEKKEESSASKTKKEETPKIKKEEIPPSTKVKKAEVVKGKKEEETLKKEERKSARKGKVGEEVKEDKDDKKAPRVTKKEKEEEKNDTASDESISAADVPKKRITRRKLLTPDAPKEQAASTEGDTVKKAVPKDQKVVEKKEKEIPRTLERRDSRAAEKKEVEKKESSIKPPEKREPPVVEKKINKAVEEKKKKDRRATKDDVANGSDDSVEDKEAEVEKPEPKVNYPIGCKLRVKYGKGKNQKNYIAKVVGYGRDAGHKTYRVHYAGWNTRYDEWIRPDRVVAVLDRPEASKFSKIANLPKQGSSITSAIKKVAASARLPAKTQEIFRTPKLISSKTRATRSSSTENIAGQSVKRTGLGKRMTRRGSTVTDSTGSRSPESQMSSDAEENVDSVEDDDSMKDDKEEDGEDEVLDVENEDKARHAAQLETELQEKTALDASEEDESAVKESSISELGSERTDDDDTEEYEEKTDKSKEYSKGDIETNYDYSTSEEVSAESVEKPKGVFSKGETETVSAKPVKPVVTVTEVAHAVDEIYSVCGDTTDPASLEKSKESYETPENISLDVSVKDEKPLSDIKPGANIFENIKEDAVPLTECMSESGSTPVAKEVEFEECVANQSIPLLKKEVIDSNVDKAEDKPTGKPGRGRKKDSSKESVKKSIRTLDMSGTSMASSSAEIPMLEPMEPAMQALDPVHQQKETSPYDFEEDADSSWKPEITKKWEPTTLAAGVVADIIKSEDSKALKTEVGDEEREKKKVKKKAKKKPISPEFVVEIKPEDTSSVAEESSQKSMGSTAFEETVAAETCVTTEKTGLRKKGRKKKDDNVGAKKDTIDQYETTVNSVVEAVKHSLQGADSDQDERPNVKRRRPKRVSESDGKDVRSTKVMRKLGAKKTSKSITTASGEKSNLDSSESQNIPESSGASALISHSEEGVDSNGETSAREPSFCESQGFEPQSEPQDDSATLVNTPPTTPEHDEGSNSAPLKELEKGEPLSQSQNYSPSSLSEPQCQKDISKVVCSSSSATSSLTLSTSSTTIITSHVQSSTKSSSESPSDNDVVSTASTDNLDSGATNQQSESSGTDQDTQDAPTGAGRKRRQLSEGQSPSITSQPKKKKRVHGTRSRTAKKSPKYTGNSDSQGSASNTPNHYPPESPPTKFVDVSKSPRPCKYNFSADMGEYLEGEARCSFLIAKMKEIKTIYMNLKAEVATIDRRRKRAKRKEKDGSQVSVEKESTT